MEELIGKSIILFDHNLRRKAGATMISSDTATLTASFSKDGEPIGECYYLMIVMSFPVHSVTYRCLLLQVL